MAITINFKNVKIRELCENASTAQRRLGADCARKLRARLSDLEAAWNVKDLIAGNPHPLEGEFEEMIGIALAKGSRLVFSADHSEPPRRQDGSIEWSQVRIVRIEFIGDYHG